MWTWNAKRVRLAARSDVWNTPSVSAASASRRTEAWYAWNPVTPIAALCLHWFREASALLILRGHHIACGACSALHCKRLRNRMYQSSGCGSSAHLNERFR